MKKVLLPCFKREALIFIILLFLVKTAYAQDITVSGTVTDESGTSLPGVYYR